MQETNLERDLAKRVVNKRLETIEHYNKQVLSITNAMEIQLKISIDLANRVKELEAKC